MHPKKLTHIEYFLSPNYVGKKLHYFITQYSFVIVSVVILKVIRTRQIRRVYNSMQKKIKRRIITSIFAGVAILALSTFVLSFFGFYVFLESAAKVMLRQSAVQVTATNTPNISTSTTVSATTTAEKIVNDTVSIVASVAKNVIAVPVTIVSHIFQHSPVWGAYAGDHLSSMPQFEQLVGSKVDLQAIFIGWYEPFPLRYGPQVRDEGKTLVLFWEQYDISLDEIINGSADRYIDGFAKGAKVYDGPIILVPFHEMNGDWTPWSGAVKGNSPAKVILAWKHIHDRFKGISNVKFAWNVNSTSHPNTEENAIKNYYPGDEYVDYVSVDGFNDGNPWLTFGRIFDNVLLELSQYHKPIYILSMASKQGPQKPDWIINALTIEIHKHKEIVGWVWFNQNKEANWLVNSDLATLAAFKQSIPQ